MNTKPKVIGEQMTSETRNCLVCNGAFVPSKLPGLVKCGICGFVSADASYTDLELHSLYGEDYFHGAEYLNYINEEESLRVNFRHRLSTLATLDSKINEARLFEIGCAYGFFLDEARSQLKSVSGVDISEPAVKFARTTFGVDAECTDYLKLSLSEPQDIIAMWDTIEHLGRPDLFIQKVAKDLRKGGLFAITTGDIGSLNARLRGRSWRMIHPPTHMHYFSVPTLSKLLDSSGFDVVHVSHPGNSRLLRSIFYHVVGMKLDNQKFYQWLSHLSVSNVRLTLNLFDIMFLVARRR